MTAPPLQAALFVMGSIIVSLMVHLVIWRRLILKTQLPSRLTVTRRLFAFPASLFPIGMIQLLLMRHVPRWLARPLMTTVFAWLGLTIFLLWAVLLFEVLRLILQPSQLTERRLARLGIFSAVVVSIYAVLQAGAQPNVVTTQFGVKPELAGYRIVLLTDLHIGPTLGRSFATEVVHKVNSLGADLIIIAGDMVDGSVTALEPEVAPLKELSAKDGVIFVLGNHEYLSDADPWIEHATSFGWHVLRNTRLSLPRMDVIGLDEFPPSEPSIFTLLLRRFIHLPPESTEAPYGRTQSRPTILVGHEPLVFREACRSGVDVALAGHTHGGQIVPFGLADWIQHGYLAGPYSCGDTHLYVSSGTGFWGPPMRLGTHSEISLIELVSR